MDVLGEERVLSKEEISRRKVCVDSFWKYSRMKEAFIAQRARSKWLKEGDSNTKYFHVCLNKRRRVNMIHGLRIGGVWREEATVVKEEVYNHFKNMFSEEVWPRSRLDGVPFKRLSDNDNAMLMAEFSIKEIEEAVWGCESNKCPGPDGYNFAFIKKIWYIIKEDFCKMLNEFHSHGKLPRGSNASFLTLIPKVDSPLNLGDFRPISLLGCGYKILSKILAARLGKVMRSIISECQSAFLQGGNILDGVVIVNELIDYAKKRRTMYAP